VARYQGRVVFVRHALPGETVRARLTDGAERSKFWRADAIEVLVASPDRVVPPCPLAGPGRCGGCDWQHATPAAQRELKAAVITEQLQRLAKLEPGQDGTPEVLVEAVTGAGDDGLGWRTRVRFAIDDAGRAGFRKHRSHEVIEVEDCLIADPQVTGLQLGEQQWGTAAAVEVITPSEGDPLVVVEAEDDEAPAGRPRGPRGPKAPKAPRRPSRTARPGKSGAALLKLPKLPVPSSVATRDAAGLHQVRGRTWVSEQVLISGAVRTFRITGTGFWQVHPGAAQSLLDAVLAAADPRPGERTVDLYGGVGLFAAGLADRVGPEGSVLAVEADARATSDARRSLHDLDWIRFETGPVEALLPVLTQDGGPLADGADVVVLDPPRAGAGKEVINRIAGLRPRVIVYVACDPAALARDLATAAAAGYKLSALRAFDQFPMTHHVECVATLVAGSPASSIDPGTDPGTEARTGADATRTPGGIS
jgi:tRNA/tmRNA/rRNA uracil-C5-methylase (TrmA/RlmC/RlmD family)